MEGKSSSKKIQNKISRRESILNLHPLPKVTAFKKKKKKPIDPKSDIKGWKMGSTIKAGPGDGTIVLSLNQEERLIN